MCFHLSIFCSFGLHKKYVYMHVLVLDISLKLLQEHKVMFGAVVTCDTFILGR